MAESARPRAGGVPWYQRAGVWVGIATGPGTFTVGGALSSMLPLGSLFLIIPIGALMLAGLTVAQAFVCRRRREPSTVRAVNSFGPNWGSTLLNIIVALGTLGWFSFYAGLAGFAMATLVDLPGWLGALLIALGLYFVNILGLDRWNALVWLTALSTIGVAAYAMYSVGTTWAPDRTASIGAGEFLWAVGSVVAYGLLFAVRVGDFAWDLERDDDVFKAGLSLYIPLVIFLSIGALTYRAVGDWNIADVLARSESTALGNIFLIISVIAPAMSGFHSGSLAIPTFTPLGKRGSTILIAVLGFALGAVRFDRQLLLFLDLLGSFLAPALVVMLLMAVLKASPVHHQTTLKTIDFRIPLNASRLALSLPTSSSDAALGRLAALVAWLVGSAAALVAKWQGEISPVLVGIAVSLVVFGGSLLLARLGIRAIPTESRE